MLIKVLAYILIIFLWIGTVWGVESINALLFDDSIKQLDPSRVDPFNYIFDSKMEQMSQDKSMGLEEKRNIAFLRGFYQEGNNLQDFCTFNTSSEYPSIWDKNRAQRSLLANIQYIGLKKIMGALAVYSRKLGYNNAEYVFLGEKLVTNYCSENITFLSRKNLFKWFNSFYSDSKLKLPTIAKKGFIGLNNFDNCKDCLELEMSYTIMLFRSFCSWGGLSDHKRFLSPFIRNPILFAYFLREIFGEKLAWESFNNLVYVTRDSDKKIILCEDLTCRKVYKDEFIRKIPRSFGGKDARDDFKRIYCADFKTTNLNFNDEDDSLKKLAKEMSEDDYNNQISQFLAIVTQVPDVILRSSSVINPAEMFIRSLDQTWLQWSSKQIKKTMDQVYFEEPLRLELVDRKYYFNRTEENFQVIIDVNVGELDKSNQIIGKISIAFNLKISKSLLKWFRNKWKEFDPSIRQNFNRKSLKIRFAKYLTKQVNTAKKQFVLPPWKEGLERLISTELLEQVAQYEGSFFLGDSNELITIPVQLNYAPFALKYIRYKFLTDKKNIEKTLQKQN